ncbi:MAG TPA: tryptophan--tRNA ligase [Polyangia bacterium]|jgi:tryptophanyl-tRNA synthetase
MAADERPSIFSGIQPSGELHIGNYLGAIRNWVGLIETHRCLYSIVDYHAITQSYEPADLPVRVREMAVDLLACGIDPTRAVLFRQSAVQEHTELAWILSCSAQFGELGRMTQFKDKSARQEDNINVGLFTYPVLMAADILVYRATHVPVGDDQIQHLELAREIARRFNARYGETFPEPKAILSSTPRVRGLDGQAKMSKSLGNTISLRDPPDVIRKKLASAVTDPNRQRRADPGNPDVCNVFALHGRFSPPQVGSWVREGCTTATIGCVECKRSLADNMAETLAPIRERALDLADRPDYVRDVLQDGAGQARSLAAATMAVVRRTIGIDS